VAAHRCAGLPNCRPGHASAVAIFTTPYRGLLVFLVLIGAVAGCAGGSMTSYRLERDSSSLESLSADGALLADQAAKSRVPAPFVAAHASEVGADLGDLASVVRSTDPDPGLGAKTRRLALLAQRATDLLEQLEHSPNDQALARSVHARLAAIGAEAATIGSGQ
jgi:hypothetical protein